MTGQLRLVRFSLDGMVDSSFQQSSVQGILEQTFLRAHADHSKCKTVVVESGKHNDRQMRRGGNNF